MSSQRQSPSDRDAAHGGGELEREVLLSGFLVTVAAGTIGGLVAHRAMRIRSLRLGINDAGSAGTTTLQIHINGSSVGSVSIANTDTNGTSTALGLDQAVAVGDRVELVLSAAATAATDAAALAVLVYA